MAYAIVFEFGPEVDQKQYDAVNEKLGFDMQAGTGDLPQGLRAHAAGPLADGGWAVIELWDSKAAQESWFGGTLAGALSAVGVAAPTRLTDSELHRMHVR